MLKYHSTRRKAIALLMVILLVILPTLRSLPESQGAKEVYLLPLEAFLPMVIEVLPMLPEGQRLSRKRTYRCRNPGSEKRGVGCDSVARAALLACSADAGKQSRPVSKGYRSRDEPLRSGFKRFCKLVVRTYCTSDLALAM